MIQSIIVAFLYGAESLDIQIYSQIDLNIIIDLLPSFDVCQQTHRQTLNHRGQVQHGRRGLAGQRFFRYSIYWKRDERVVNNEALFYKNIQSIFHELLISVDDIECRRSLFTHLNQSLVTLSSLNVTE